MPYVMRNERGGIIGISDRPSAEALEHLAADHPDVLTYLKEASPSAMMERLSRTDMDMARITEDLIDVLISRNILNFTDLPLQAQRKLVGRQKLRRNLSALSNLVSDEDDII